MLTRNMSAPANARHVRSRSLAARAARSACAVWRGTSGLPVW